MDRTTLVLNVESGARRGEGPPTSDSLFLVMDVQRSRVIMKGATVVQ